MDAPPNTGRTELPPKPILSPREAYILDVAPALLAVIITRRRADNANAMADEAMDAASGIWDRVNSEKHPLNDYLLDALPGVLAGFQVKPSVGQPLR